jgi:hypothetical protein
MVMVTFVMVIRSIRYREIYLTHILLNNDDSIEF